MTTKTKALILALCAVLLVVSTAFVTVAFLTSEDTVTNTFTVGMVQITLDEAKVNTDGTYLTDVNNRTRNNAYHLLPNHKYIKDPVIHVDKDSEDCWLFVKIVNGLEPIIAGASTVSDTDSADTVYNIDGQLIKNGWTCIDETNGIWCYERTASALEDIHVFDTFTIKADADVAEYATQLDTEGKVAGGKYIEVTAYAVQADGFNVAGKTATQNATDAWNATFGN